MSLIPLKLAMATFYLFKVINYEAYKPMLDLEIYRKVIITKNGEAEFDLKVKTKKC